MKTMDVEVVDIRKMAGDGKCRAAADVRFGEGLVVRGFFVFEGWNGVFVSLPRRASKAGNWFDMIEVEDGLKRSIEDKVLEAYDRETDGVRG